MSEAAIAEPPRSVRQDLRVGGKYTAIDNGDGTFDIKDVCVFAEIPAGVKRNADPIGREWQQAALLQNKAREAEGHLPPVHIYHTDETTVKPQYAGKMRLCSVRQIVYEGKKLWATFADILGVPAEVFAKVKKGFLPYRSVEIHNWAKPEIDSLALMDTDVPFFRMPMLSVGSILQRDSEIFMDRTRPSVARRLGKKEGGLILFKFSEGRTVEDDEDKEKKGSASGLNKAPQAGETEKEAEADLDEKSEGKAKEGPGGAEMEDEGATAEKPEAILGEEEKAPESDTNGAVMSQLQSIGMMMKQILERLGPLPAAEEKHEPVNGVHLGQEAMGQDFKDVTDTKVEFKEDDKMADPKATPALDQEALLTRVAEAAVLKATGPLMAELNKFKAEQGEQVKKAEVKTRFEAAVKELTDNGQDVSPELSAHLLKSAGHGDEFLKEQVAVFKATLPKEPPADAETFESGLVDQIQNGDDSDVINAFCAKHGSQNLKFAKEQMADFKAAQAVGAVDMPADEYLDINFRAVTMKRRNKV